MSNSPEKDPRYLNPRTKRVYIIINNLTCDTLSLASYYKIVAQMIIKKMTISSRVGST